MRHINSSSDHRITMVEIDIAKELQAHIEKLNVHITNLRTSNNEISAMVQEGKTEYAPIVSQLACQIEGMHFLIQRLSAELNLIQGQIA